MLNLHGFDDEFVTFVDEFGTPHREGTGDFGKHTLLILGHGHCNTIIGRWIKSCHVHGHDAVCSYGTWCLLFGSKKFVLKSCLENSFDSRFYRCRRLFGFDDKIHDCRFKHNSFQ